MSKKRAAIYIRVGDQSQVEEATDRQKVACEHYANSAQLHVVTIYNEVTPSTPLDQMSMFQKLLTDSKRGLFEVAIVQSAESIGLDLLDVMIYKQRLMNNGVELMMVESKRNATPEEMIATTLLESLIGPILNRIEEHERVRRSAII